MSEYCKVVIVDDEFIMRQGMKHMLDWEKEGYPIVGEATNGKEGLELIEAVRPDIVLADIVMPVLDGIEFSKILKARFPQVQLVILSSYDKFEYVKETLLNGAADYILKPALNPDILLKTLNKVAERIPGMQIRKTQHTSSSAQIEKFLLGFVPRLDEALFAEIFPHTLYRVTGMDLGAVCGGDKAQMAQAVGDQAGQQSGDGAEDHVHQSGAEQVGQKTAQRHADDVLGAKDRQQAECLGHADLDGAVAEGRQHQAQHHIHGGDDGAAHQATHRGMAVVAGQSQPHSDTGRQYGGHGSDKQIHTDTPADRF